MLTVAPCPSFASVPVVFLSTQIPCAPPYTSAERSVLGSTLLASPADTCCHSFNRRASSSAIFESILIALRRQSFSLIRRPRSVIVLVPLPAFLRAPNLRSSLRDQRRLNLSFVSLFP